MPTLDTSIAVKFDFIVKQNQTFNPLLTFTDDVNEPIDFTGAQVKMSVREKYRHGGCAPCGINDSNFNQAYKQDFAPTVTGVDNNQLQFSGLINLAHGHYVYDLLVVWPNGEQQYYLRGNFKVQKSYTDATDN